MKLSHVSGVISSNLKLNPAVEWAAVCFMFRHPRGQLRPQYRLSYSDIHHSSRLYPVGTSKYTKTSSSPSFAFLCPALGK